MSSTFLLFNRLSQDDEKQPSVDVIIQLLQNEDLKSRVKTVLKTFVEVTVSLTSSYFDRLFRGQSNNT